MQSIKVHIQEVGKAIKGKRKMAIDDHVIFVVASDVEC